MIKGKRLRKGKSTLYSPKGILMIRKNHIKTNKYKLVVILFFFYTAFFFTSSTAHAEVGMTSPMPATTLDGSTEKFSWHSAKSNVSKWWLYIGNSIGGSQYYNSGNLGESTHQIVKSLPSDGSTIYSRLWYYQNGAWYFIDTTYTAATDGTTSSLPEIVLPESNSKLGSSINLVWSNNNKVTSWWIYAGNSLDSNSYYDSGNIPDAATNSRVVTGIPQDGSVVYIKLWYKTQGIWRSVNSSYVSHDNKSNINIAISKKIAISKNDQNIYIAFNEIGNPSIYKAEKLIYTNEFIKSEIEYSSNLNKIFYLETTYSNNENHLYINGEKKTSTVFFRKNLILHDNYILWLETSTGKNNICKALIKYETTTLECKSLNYVPFEMSITANGIITILGKDLYKPKHNTTHINRYQIDDLTLISSQKPNNIVRHACLKCLSTDKKLWAVSGNGNLLNLYHQLSMFFGEQYGEPYSFSNDYMGRLSWNQSYRLRAIYGLYKATGVIGLKKAYNDSASSILKRTNEISFGRFHSKKYGLKRTKKIAFLVNNAIIYHSILAGIDILNEENYRSVINYAELMFDSYESDWHNNHYRFPYGEDIKYDGIPLPFNQQNAMGLLAIELYKATQKTKYIERISALHKYFTDQFSYKNSTLIWHYWPQFFYDGWLDSDSVSKNTPSKIFSTDSLFEDYFHASINLEFLINANSVLNKSLSVEPEKILLNSISDEGFSRFISGDVEYQQADWSFVPTYPWTLFDSAKSLYLKKFIKAPDYDNQDFTNAVLAIENQSNSQLIISNNDTKEILFECYESNQECKSDLLLFFYGNTNYQLNQ